MMNKKDPGLEWWGYLHVNGSVQAKRFFDKRDLDEAWESDFVVHVVGPFPATNRAEALDKVKWGVHNG